MSTNGTIFRAKINGWATATQAQIEGLARQTCFQMAENVVRSTPVDTGFLRGSWQPSINGPADEPGSADPSGVATIAEVMLSANGMTPGDTFYMLNNAKYARHVEYGTSKMAGRHYVGDNVAKWPAVVAKVAKELNIK